MLEEVTLLCQRLISPLKLWILLPLIPSDITPESSFLSLLSSVSPSPLEHSHQYVNMLYCSFKILFLFFYCSSATSFSSTFLHSRTYEKSYVNLLTFPHFLLTFPRIKSGDFHLQHSTETVLDGHRYCETN